MEAQSRTLRLEIPLKPICLVSGKVGIFEGLWRAIQVPEKYAEQGAKGMGTSAEEAWCEVLTTSAGAGPGFPSSHSQQGRARLCRAGKAGGTAAGSLRQQESHISPILLWQNWPGLEASFISQFCFCCTRHSFFLFFKTGWSQHAPNPYRKIGNDFLSPWIDPWVWRSC